MKKQKSAVPEECQNMSKPFGWKLNSRAKFGFHELRTWTLVAQSLICSRLAFRRGYRKCLQRPTGSTCLTKHGIFVLRDRQANQSAVASICLMSQGQPQSCSQMLEE